MDFAYQADIARVFGGSSRTASCVRLQVGPLVRPVRTALAEAEIEYEDHRRRLDPRGASPGASRFFDGCPGALMGRSVEAVRRLYAVIWTTTPWTLPANRAITLGPKIEYVLLRSGIEPGTAYLVADALVPQVTAALGWRDAHPLPHPKKSGETIAKASLAPRYVRPFSSDPSDNFGFLLGEHVSTTDGTGLVHTAPGHGRDDYEVVRRAGFKVDDPALCPVDEAGYYDANAPEFLRRKRVVTPRNEAEDANLAVLEALRDGRAGASILLSQKSSPHSYPHCWRCKNPVIFRATHQWFIDLGALRDRAMAEIRGRVTWIPSYSENRIGAMVDNRLEWTISRQRRWGSPITFLRCAPIAARRRRVLPVRRDDAAERRFL